MKSIIRLAIALSLVTLVWGHARLITPPGRSTLWRDPNFAHFNPPINERDDEIWCGHVDQLENDTRCGVCGDAITDPVPRPNEHGGKYGLGIIAGQYSPGEVIPVNINFTVTHYGWFEMQLCHRIPETENCFQPLMLGNGATRMDILTSYGKEWVNTTVTLPTNIQCRQCILRMHYFGGHQVGDCGDGREEQGCGPQQQFRSCADISIMK